MSDISQIKLPDNTTYNINAKTVNGHTVSKDVPSSAVFTDQYVSQVSSATEDDDYRVLLSGTASDNTQTESVRKSAGLRFNPKYDAITIGYDRASGSAYGVCSLTQGSNIVASGQYSHGEGWWTIANHRSQHVFGEYNIADDSSAIVSNRGNYIEIVGNGTENSRSNARTLDWSGNEVLAGNLTIGGQLTDKWGLQSIRPMTRDAYNALSYAEKHNGTYYHLTDVDTVPSLDCNVKQTPNTTGTDAYPVLFSSSNSSGEVVGGTYKNPDFYYSPSFKRLTLKGNISVNTSTNGQYTQVSGTNLTIYDTSDTYSIMQIAADDIILPDVQVGGTTYENSWGGIDSSLQTSISSLKSSLSNLHLQYDTLLNNQDTTTTETSYSLSSGKKFSDYQILIFEQRYDVSDTRFSIMIQGIGWVTGRVLYLNCLHGSTAASASTYNVSGITVKYNSDTTFKAQATGAAGVKKVSVFGIKLSN